VSSCTSAWARTTQAGPGHPGTAGSWWRGVINALLSADSGCGAAYGAREAARVNRRNGCRHRDMDTRIGTLDVAVPSLREGSPAPNTMAPPNVPPARRDGECLWTAPAAGIRCAPHFPPRGGPDRAAGGLNLPG
jgi:Transposase, Mutator family